MPGHLRTVQERLLDLLAVIQPATDTDAERFIAYTEAAAELGRIAERLQRTRSLCDSEPGALDHCGHDLEWLSANYEAARERLSLHACKIEDRPARQKLPATPAELRTFALAVQLWADRRDERLGFTAQGRAVREKARRGDDVLTGYSEAVWLALVRVAGERPIPVYEPGPYTRDRFRAALGRVVQWCNEQLPKEVVAAQGTTTTPPNKVTANGPDPTFEYVTLDQIAATVKRKKKTLERALNKQSATMPKPDIQGGGGKPHEWRWDRIRPWLEKEYGRKLPERFFSLRAGH